MTVSKEQIDFGIITILDVEFEAVYRKLERRKPVQNPGEPTYYKGFISSTLNISKHKIVLVQINRSSNVSSGLSTLKLIQRWKPKHLILVGIAAGMSEKTQLGGVVIATDIYYFESEKILQRSVEPRHQTITCHKLLVDRARAIKRENKWIQKIELTPSPSVTSKIPKAQFGVIAAGEKVQASGTIFNKLRRFNSKIIALAMEGWGLADAAHQENGITPFIEIRSISDYADSSKEDSCHEYAADVAATFAVELIRNSVWADNSIKPIAVHPKRITSVKPNPSKFSKTSISTETMAKVDEKIKAFLSTHFSNRYGNNSPRLNIILTTLTNREMINPTTFIRSTFGIELTRLARNSKNALFDELSPVKAVPGIGTFSLVQEVSSKGQRTRDITTSILIDKQGILSISFNDLYTALTNSDVMDSYHQINYIEPEQVRLKLAQAWEFIRKFLKQHLEAEPMVYNLYFHDLSVFHKFEKAPANTSRIITSHKSPPNPMQIFDEYQQIQLGTLARQKTLIEGIIESIEYSFKTLDY